MRRTLGLRLLAGRPATHIALDSGREAQGPSNLLVATAAFPGPRRQRSTLASKAFMAVEVTKPPRPHDGDQPSQFRSKSPERPLDRDVWQEASGAGFDNSRRRALRSILVSTARFR